MTPVRLVALAAAVVSLAVASGATAADAPKPRLVSSHGQAAPLPRLVFFMNPNGMPCQMQDRILRDMGVELTERAQLVYYKTTEPGDIPMFQQYGIRALPSLLVTDANGRELRRGTPGILQMPEVLRLLQR